MNGLLRLTRPGVWAMVIAAVLAAAWVLSLVTQEIRADPDDPDLVAEGQRIYAAHCASCHGAKLEGQPNWQKRLPNGRLPAPPHDATGHTWHHPDEQLFVLTKYGIEAFLPDYQSDMPGFGSVLLDREIWAVLAYIKSTWPQAIRERQARLKAKE